MLSEKAKQCSESLQTANLIEYIELAHYRLDTLPPIDYGFHIALRDAKTLIFQKPMLHCLKTSKLQAI